MSHNIESNIDQRLVGDVLRELKEFNVHQYSQFSLLGLGGILNLLLNVESSESVLFLDLII